MLLVQVKQERQQLLNQYLNMSRQIFFTDLYKTALSIISWTSVLCEWNQIAEDQTDRTIGVNIHSKRLFNDMLYLIYDLGGQESYYSLHAVFLDLENAFFVVVVDLSKDDVSLKNDIQKQLSIISSKLPKEAKAEFILVGTHVDMIQDKVQKESVCKEARLATDCQNLEFVEEIFINATLKSSSELVKITQLCRKLGENVQNAMVSFVFLKIPPLLKHITMSISQLCTLLQNTRKKKCPFNCSFGKC